MPHSLLQASEQLEQRLLLTTLIVDDDFAGFANGANVENGIIGIDRFGTIQAAADVAADGDTLQVEAGTYNESVSINASITVEASSEAVINPPDGEDGVLVNSGDVALRGLVVRNARNGIVSKTTGSISLLDVESSENSQAGFRASRASSVTIDSLTATENGAAGIQLADVGSVVLVGAVRANDNGLFGLDILRSNSVSIETGLFSGIAIRDADSIATSNQTINSFGPVVLDSRNEIALNGTINSDSYAISVHANSDGAGESDLVMAPEARLITDQEAPNAVSISVNTLLGGNGNAYLSLAQAGTSTGLSSISVSAIGGAIVDANDSLDNVVASSATLDGLAGVGIDTASVIPFDPIDTRLNTLHGAASGGFFVRNAGALQLGEATGTDAVRTTTSGSIEIEATSPLTVVGNITSANKIELRARDTWREGDDLTITGGAYVTAAGSIVLDAGDNAILEVDSSVTSLSSTVLVQLDSDNFDEELGSVARIDGVINSTKGATIVGGRDSDQILVSAVGVGGLSLDGFVGDDEITVTYPSLPNTFGSEITIDDAGGGYDRVTINGTPESDELFLTSDNSQTANDAERVTRIDAHNEPIAVRDGIDELNIDTGDSSDLAHIQPSSLSRIFVDGGAPCVGHPGVPPGDVLDFQPLGNQFTITDRSLLTFGPDFTYPPVMFSGFETLPVTELGAGEPLLFDFNHTNTASSVATSPTEPGYRSVRGDTIYSDELGYGWQPASEPSVDGNTDAAVVSSFERNDGYYFGPQAALIQDGHSLDDNQTFTVAVETAGYYYFSALVGSPYTDIEGVSIRNEDAQKIIVDNINTKAGESTVINFVAYTDDGTIDLTFVNSVETPTIFGINAISVRPAQLLSMGLDTCGKHDLIADGVTVDSLPLYGAEPGAYVSVSSTMGTILNPDVDPEIQGVQIQADESGQAVVQIRREFGIGTNFIKLEDVRGRGLGHATLNFVPPNQRYFDFNHLNRFSNSVPSPTQTPEASASNPNAFVGVLPTDIYSTGSGFGWLKEGGSFDNGELVNDPRSNFNRDGAIAHESNTFFVELPNDLYDVTVTMGTLQDLDGLRIRANGDNVLYGGETQAGEYLQTSFQVDVKHGLLQLDFGNSGVIPNWAVNGVEIRSASLVTPIVFDSLIGSRAADGFNSATLTADSDLEAGQQVTVSSSLGTITTPDVNSEIAGIQVNTGADGKISFDLLAPTHSGVPVFTAKSLDGKHQGETQDESIISYFVPDVRRFDFNHVNNGWESGESKTADGALGVTRLDRDADVAGFGWIQAPNSYDNRTPNGADQGLPNMVLQTDIDIHQDYASGHADTGGRTFLIEVKPDVEYDIRVFTGSRLKDQSIQVRVEGSNQVQSIATTASFYSSLTFFNVQDTNGDNMLEISLGSGGELSPLWMANGVDIAESSVGLPAAAPYLLTNADLYKLRHRQESNLNPISSLVQLDDATLQIAVQQSINNLIQADLSQGQLQRLQKVDVTIADLNDPRAVGLAGSRHVLIDDDAAGFGWFLGSGKAPTAVHSPGQIDLAFVVLHELGHIIGLPDFDPTLEGMLSEF